MRIKCFLLSVLVLFFFPALAQDVESSKKIPSTYDRSAITLFQVQFSNENHASDVQSKIDKISFSDKYYNNNLDNITFNASFNRTTPNPAEAIKQYLNEQQVGRHIISKWFARQSDGAMSMDLIFDRGMFNATDAAYIKAQSTKRGNAVLQDYGNRLIGKSYVLVLDYQSVQTMKEAKMMKLKGWKSTVTGYLFKIKYTDEIQNEIYDTWIYPDDSPEVMAEKNRKFEQLSIPVEFVTKTTVFVTASQPEETTQLGRFFKVKTEEELLVDMVQKGYDESLYFLEKSHEDFMVKTTIYQVRPIRAKIGKKEGLKCDNRYFAYEYVYDEKTNSSKPVRRGVIRATSSIVDNRHVATGDMATSKFYQTAGRRLRTGYLLRQQNDYGLELSMGYESGEVGGVYGRVDARLGRYIGIKSLFVYVEVGYEVKNYSDPYSFGVENDIAFTHYGAGLAKGFMLAKNIEFRPYIGIGQESATHKDWKDVGGDLKVPYVKGGANLALNLNHNFQLMGGMGYYSFFGNAENDNGETDFEWDVLFKDRAGASMMVGVKIMF